mmetsp:Transcript_36944/g.83569  ORF Transcript_36944/g.83569 Transcript_36944/m.83569 type:complete len:307 (+) Transcript_36944:1293-2213(+)
MHEEDLMICSRARQAMVVDGVSVFHDLVHNLAAACSWVRSAEDISAHIAASCDGVHAASVDGPHGVLDVPLDNAMQLPCLTCSDLQGCVCELLANVVHGNPLLGCAVTARHTHTDHETECILDAHFLAFLAHVSVVLLVAAVRLDELGILEWHLTSGDVIKSLLQAASELPCLHLDHLVRLDRAVILSTCCSCFHPKLGVQLALELSKPCMVLVDVLVIAVANRHEPACPELLQYAIQVAGRLGKVNLGVFCALAPIVRVAETKNCVLHAAKLSLKVGCSVRELAPKVPAVAWKFALACCGNTEDN